MLKKIIEDNLGQAVQVNTSIGEALGRAKNIKKKLKENKAVEDIFKDELNVLSNGNDNIKKLYLGLIKKNPAFKKIMIDIVKKGDKDNFFSKLDFATKNK